MKTRRKNRILSVILCLVMLISLMPTSAFAYGEQQSAEGNAELETTVYDYTKPVGVTMQRLTGHSVGEFGEEGNLGDDLLFVIKSGERYYAMKDVAAREEAYKAIPAVDVTNWVNADGSLTVPADTLDVAFWRYEERPDYELGMFINGREDYISYTYDYESEDGDDNYYNDAERTYTAEFKIKTFEDGQWISKPGYWSENLTSGTLQFGGSWSYKISSYNYLTLKYNLITDLRSDGNGGQEFYFRYLGTDVEYEGDEVEGYLYYAKCRHQATIRHAEYDAPTCMLKGCEEYWYCENCNRYWKDKDFSEQYGEEMPVIPATGHDWDNEGCKNCNRPVPVYSKVTNQADFDALADDTMFILVAEFGGKYYTPDLAEMYLYMMDSDGDGFMDIYDVDENGNGVSDMFEIDGDENGIYDYLEYDYVEDGVNDEQDWLFYHEQLCMAYLSDKMYGNSSIGVKEVFPNADGTFSHDAVKGAVEFEMVDLYTDDEIDWMISDLMEYEDWWSEDYRYTYECVKQFVIPNMFVGAPNMLPMERQYRQRIAEVGDTYSWGVLFYNDAANYNYYSYDAQGPVSVELHDACKTDSAVLFSTFDYYWYEQERPQAMLRLRDYNGELSFVTAQAWELDGWEWVEDPETGEGYYDTKDTQACVYLYASQQASHICEFGNWKDNKDGRTHTGTCECGETKTVNHNWNNGVETKPAKCDEEGVKTFTCGDCGATKTEVIDVLGHEWSSWTDDGANVASDTHIRSCKRDNCNETEQVTHSWGRWMADGDANHKKTCSVCSGTRTDTHKWNDGVITTPSTEDKEGVKTYTCTVCSHTKNEAVDKLEHVHNWSSWGQNDENTHIRSCRCNETQTEGHNFDEGVVINWATHIAPGERHYTCEDCGYVKSETIPALEEHEWSDWKGNDDGRTHTHECLCGESETLDHNWSTWAEQAAGGYQRTCSDCGASEAMILDEEKPINTTVNTVANTNLTNTDIELIDKVLTDEEQSQVAEGAEVKVYLKVEDISNETPTEHKEKAEAKAGDDEIGMYLDIDLFKQVGNAAETPVTETAGAVSITITIPDNLINTDASVTRIYKIIRVHEDQNGNLITDVIEGIFNSEDKTFTFETDKFSTYALAYADTTTTNSPQTGDNNMMWLWIALLFVSGVDVMATTVNDKKRFCIK